MYTYPIIRQLSGLLCFGPYCSICLAHVPNTPFVVFLQVHLNTECTAVEIRDAGGALNNDNHVGTICGCVPLTGEYIVPHNMKLQWFVS